MATFGIDYRRNSGGQYYCRLDLASNIRFRFAELHRRCDRRFDGGTRLGVFETNQAEEVIPNPDKPELKIEN